jgi:hypothetical protein
MGPPAAGRDHGPMTATSAPTRHLLVPVARAASRREAKIRHYRLARLHLNAGRDPRGPDRFEHLRRSYD